MSFSSLQQQARAAWDRFTEPGRRRILVGAGTCGRAAGADEVGAAIRQLLSNSGLEADLYSVGCLGLCFAEPLVELSAPDMPCVLYRDVRAENVEELLNGYFEGGEPQPEAALATMDGASLEGVPAFGELPAMRGQARVVLRNCGIIDPESIDHYIARGGYEGLNRALEKPPEEVVREVLAAGLRGRGGAGFPTGRKWQFCRQAEADQKYMICNADEGDPGAFMDRSLLESDPHAVLEGMAIAAYAIGADRGYIYVRAEYPLAIERLRLAMTQAEERGLLGEDILGSGVNFGLTLEEGAGAFVCGEETALLASLEGRRGMPRPRPPFPARRGLFGKPTNINNVETLANVPGILREGSQPWQEHGTENSPGTKTFALAGKVRRTGLVEVPMGMPLREVIFGIGGGIPEGGDLKAVQTGGPSGGCIPADQLHLPVDYEALQQAGSIMGSGGMVVMDQDSCMVDVARYFIEFTQSESCGKCAPCRLGTRQMLMILTDITEGRAEPEDLDLLEQIAVSVKRGALCGLGQTAPNPVLTTLRYFRDEYEQHVHRRRCPAGVCSALVTYTIDPEICICCGRCAQDCPVDCISGTRGKPPARATDEDREQDKVGEPFLIDQEICITCGTCYEVCPVDAVQRD